jgi:hypothetical protein
MEYNHALFRKQVSLSCQNTGGFLEHLNIFKGENCLVATFPVIASVDTLHDYLSYIEHASTIFFPHPDFNEKVEAGDTDLLYEPHNFMCFTIITHLKEVDVHERPILKTAEVDVDCFTFPKIAVSEDYEFSTFSCQFFLTGIPGEKINFIPYRHAEKPDTLFFEVFPYGTTFDVSSKELSN